MDKDILRNDIICLDKYTHQKESRILLSNFPQTLISILTSAKARIAGGAIKSIFSSKSVNDYDIFFRNKNDYKKVYDYMSANAFSLCCPSTEMADTFKYDGNKSSKNMIFQLIKNEDTFYESNMVLLNHFDFTICMGLYDFCTRAFSVHINYFKDLAQRKLIFNTTAEYPLSSLVRMKKFIKQGFNISGTEIIKIALSVNNLDIKDYTVLKKQLLGIDTLFLQELTDSLGTPKYAEKAYNFDNFMRYLDEFLERNFVNEG
jgi:hypothetical protein